MRREGPGGAIAAPWRRARSLTPCVCVGGGGGTCVRGQDLDAPIHLAAGNGHAAVVAVLLQAGADMYARDAVRRLQAGGARARGGGEEGSVTGQAGQAPAAKVETRGFQEATGGGLILASLCAFAGGRRGGRRAHGSVR